MKKTGYSHYCSPERLFFLIAFACFLGYEGFFLFSSGRQTDMEHREQQSGNTENADEGARKIQALRWLAPFKSMNYQNNPFDIGFKLKIRRPVEKPVPAAEVRKKEPVKKQVLKKTPPLPKILPPRIFSVGYLGSYTNLAGISYAVLQIAEPAKKWMDKKYLTRGQQFMDFFQLQDFSDSEIVIGVKEQNSVKIAWNETRKISIPVKPAPQKK